ncbi:hypothetical protein HPHPA26_1409 [Helicobacter pylori Hp A-26]|uniref:Uncharacterized protein n=1 Tax=Helicobacter pylori Hp A-26 TaxID=992056 RepID=I9TWJ9_HELPX|nr:hypothetical protein HPHPA26_1409 [Helicobacter pylori Hp A-26]
MFLLFFALFRVIVNLYALFVCKKVFLAVIFSHANSPQHPKIQALLS